MTEGAFQKDTIPIGFANCMEGFSADPFDSFYTERELLKYKCFAPE